MNSNGLLSLMHLTPFSAAAYIIAWVVYVGYMGRILLRMRLVEAERKEMEQAKQVR